MIVEESSGDDGRTLKLTWTAADGAVYEASGFVGQRRTDLSLSSMAGCAMGCVVCSTTHSSIPFQRKLTEDEVVDEAEELLRLALPGESVVHLGFFGDGEALANWQPVSRAIRRILEHGWRIPEVTISTTGMPAGRIEDVTEFAHTLPVPLRLQVSLYSLDARVRRSLLPLARPLDDCLDELDGFARSTGAPVRYNYPVIPGKNDHRKAAADLMGFVRAAPDLRRVKLSRIFAVPGSPIPPTTQSDVERFAARLQDLGVDASIFLGDDETGDADAVHASCGQLRTL